VANLGPGLDCMGAAIDLHNTFAVSPRPGVRVRGEGAGALSEGPDNLVMRAARRAAEHLGRALPADLGIECENRIPLRRGLGSSAAAIVGGILLADALLDGGLEPIDVMRLGLEFEDHPDNLAPALFGGVCIALRDEEGVRVVRLEPPAELVPVLVVPGCQLSTRRSRRVLPAEVPLRHAVANVARAALLTAALLGSGREALGAALSDDLHQPYRLSLVPWFQDLVRAGRRAGAYGVVLSGAGPSALALSPPDRVAAVREALEGTLHRLGVEARVLPASFVAQGARVEGKYRRDGETVIQHL